MLECLSWCSQVIATRPIFFTGLLIRVTFLEQKRAGEDEEIRHRLPVDDTVIMFTVGVAHPTDILGCQQQIAKIITAQSRYRRCWRRKINLVKHEPAKPLSVKLKQAAEMLGVSQVSLRRKIECGEIAPCRAFRHILIKVSELERFLAANTVK